MPFSETGCKLAAYKAVVEQLHASHDVVPESGVIQLESKIEIGHSAALKSALTCIRALHVGSRSH